MSERSNEVLSPLQNAVFLLKQAQAKLAGYENARHEPIAIVGLGCRFPGADGPDAYWNLLREGRNAIQDVPPDRWSIDEFYDPDNSVPGKMVTKRGGFLSKVDEFDADFFGISPRETVRVDPQHRVLLETAWEALEDAGIVPASLGETRTGVYVGVIGSDYALLQAHDLNDMDVFSGTGSSHAILANRLSYFLNVRGPSIALDTACSSSLVTIDMAVKGLRSREIDIGLAAGVNLILGPAMTITLSKAHMMSPEGQCKAFDAAADGYVRGEGCGVVVLKRLSDAIAAKDRVLAVVRGTAVNHDGRSNGLSAPNGPAQEAVLRSALADARLAAEDISYIEAHGTGTRLGDPIEIEALLNAVAARRTADSPLHIGSVKTNIGHLESAAGVAGLAKVILMLRKKQIPPHLNLKRINPLLAIDKSPIRIPQTLSEWTSKTPRRAGVSSFGFGGTNAHVVVEEAPVIVEPKNIVDRPRHLLSISARSPQALSELAKRYAEVLEADGGESLADFAFTANTGRTHFSHRAAITADSLEAARKRLKELATAPEDSAVIRGTVEHDVAPKVAFLFTGQGSQYAGMGGELYRTQPTFRAAIDRCAAILDPLIGRSLVELLGPDTGATLDQTQYTQPVIFSVQFALATLWRSWGVEPAAVLGHSVGEFAAACIAGVYTLEDGLRLIAARARLMQALPAGGVMAAVMAPPSKVLPLLSESEEPIDVAALNGPETVVISGAASAVQAIQVKLEARGIKTKTLATSHAFHSHLMDPVLEPLQAAAAEATAHPPTLPIFSNLTGKPADETTYAAPDYWTRHARSPVRFHDGMRSLAELGCDVYLEIGPNPILVGMGRRCVDQPAAKWLSSLKAGRDDWQTMLDSLAEMYVSGVAVDWAGFDRDYHRRRAGLPTYPFQRKRHWVKVSETGWPEQTARMATAGGPLLHPLIGRKMVAAVSEHVFESQLSASAPAILPEHKIQGVVVMPGAAYLEMALAASAAAYHRPWTIRAGSLVEPFVPGKQPVTVQTVLTPEGKHGASFKIVSLVTDVESQTTFHTHAFGKLTDDGQPPPVAVDIAALQSQFTTEPFDVNWQVDALRKAGLQPGPGFLWFECHWLQENRLLGKVRAPRAADVVQDYQIHPGMLDSAFQLLGAGLPGAGTGIDAYIPTAVERLQVFRPTHNAAWQTVTVTKIEKDSVVGDLQILDAEGNVLVEIEGLTLRRVPRNWIARLVAGPQPEWTYEMAWLRSAAGEKPAGANDPSQWLIFDTADGLGVRLAERLQLKGHRCEVISASAREKRSASARRFSIAGDHPPGGIIYLTGADATDFDSARADGWGGALDVLHGSLDAGNPKPPRLWLMTRGAQAVGENPPPLSVAQAPVWGLGRVIASEHPALSCVRIDLDPAHAQDEADRLAEEVLFGGREDQIAFRAADRYVTRLRPLRGKKHGEMSLPKGRPYRLEIIARGQLDQVELRAAERKPPQPGEVEIKVHATGLNFRDVLNVLDLYPGDPGPLGGECAGEVVAVGEGVEHVRPGDQVLALAPASFSSFVTTLGEFVVQRPECLSAAEAATLPICFLTCWYAMRDLGNLQPGERILIHAASGGVGLAAIQLAWQAGAEIFATAGSERKREYLRSLGITHVMDSRSVDFAEQILAATNGEGVDMIVNSLTGETIRASLSVLRAGGRFLELGKTDLWDQARVDEFRPGLKFFPLALDHMMADEPATIRRLFADVMPQFAASKLEPLPLRTYSIRQTKDALRHMARAEHIGKVVIEAVDHDADNERLHLREDGTYLVTGGLGGLGLKLAQWLADHGAKHLVLTGRSAPNEQAEAQLAALAERGVKVAVRRCDVGSRAEVEALLAAVESELPPLRGVYHLAGVLDDGVLRDQSRERFDKVFAAKALGGWYLHELTANAPLEQFVLFSSAASLLGSPGQGNYAAANSLLDGLAHHRRAAGKPALSVNWGSWAEVGMAAKLKESQGSRWAEAGIGWIDPDPGMRTLESLLLAGEVQAGVLPITWPQFFARIPEGSEPLWLSEMAEKARASGVRTDSGPPALAAKLSEVTPGERLETAVNFLRRQAGQVLAMDESSLPDARRPLNELGFDSLTGVEFCNRVSRAIGCTLNPTLLFEYPTLESLAAYVVTDLLGLESGASDSPVGENQAETAEAAQQTALDEVEGMSEADMEALVMQHLERSAEASGAPRSPAE